MQPVNGWLTIFWIAMIPIATGWINSITYVASLSLWALVSGHWSAWQAARVEAPEEGSGAQGGRGHGWRDRGAGRAGDHGGEAGVGVEHHDCQSLNGQLARTNSRSRGSVQTAVIPGRSVR
jgi:hypothetical protein